MLICHSSLQFSRSDVSDSLRPHALQHARPPCPLPTLSLLQHMSIESAMSSNHLVLCCTLLLLPSIFPSIRVFSNESVLHIRWPKCSSFSFNISPSNEYSGRVSYDGLVGFPCSPRDSQEFSPTAQFKSINSSALSFLYSPSISYCPLISIHDHLKNHSSDETDLCWQSNVSAF